MSDLPGISPGKHAGSDPEASSQNQAGSYMTDPTSNIRFSFVFSNGRHGSYCAKPARIRSGWSSQCLEASWCAGIIWPGFWQDATGPLPVSHFQIRFRSSTDVPDNIVQNQPGSDLVPADCVRFWPNGSGPEASQCASGKYFPADPDRSRIGSGMFTGYVNCDSRRAPC